MQPAQLQLFAWKTLLPSSLRRGSSARFRHHASLHFILIVEVMQCPPKNASQVELLNLSSSATASPYLQFFPEVYDRRHGPQAQSTNPYWCVLQSHSSNRRRMQQLCGPSRSPFMPGLRCPAFQVVCAVDTDCHSKRGPRGPVEHVGLASCLPTQLSVICRQSMSQPSNGIISQLRC
jgi:hypothetical protein